MRVRGEREVGAGLDAHLGEGARRVDLADRLAQPGGRDLDRDAGLGDRLDERLVVEARVALGRRPVGAPDLDQVRVGDDVEEAGAGQLGRQREVAAPELVGVADRLPDVVALVVDGAVRRRGSGPSRPRSRSPRLEQVGDPVLAARDEVALDPEPQRRRADELAVGVEVVARLFLPEGVAPELERLGEAVDVLGDAELVDAVLLGRGQVAVDVLLGEVAPPPSPVSSGRRCRW